VVVGLLLLGTHGTGKTTLAKNLEKLGVKAIYSDAAVVWGKEIRKMDFLLREYLFTHYSLAGFSLFIDSLNRNENVVLDFSPLQIIPYVKYFLGKKGRILAKRIWNYYKNLRELAGKEVYHLVFIIPNRAGIKIIQYRLMKRKSPLKREEINENYIKLINDEVKKLAKRLERNGEKVVYLSAELSKEEQLKRVKELLID